MGQAGMSMRGKYWSRVSEQRKAKIAQAWRRWGNRWVWFDPEDGSGRQQGLVTLINRDEEISVSYEFEVNGCYTLPVCTIDEASQVLTLAEEE